MDSTTLFGLGKIFEGLATSMKKSTRSQHLPPSPTQVDSQKGLISPKPSTKLLWIVRLTAALSVLVVVAKMSRFLAMLYQKMRWQKAMILLIVMVFFCIGRVRNREMSLLSLTRRQQQVRRRITRLSWLRITGPPPIMRGLHWCSVDIQREVGFQGIRLFLPAFKVCGWSC